MVACVYQSIHQKFSIMKKAISFSLLVLVVSFVSCSTAGTNADIVTQTSQVVTSGSWRVSLFTDSGNNETTDFAGYAFSFSGGGTLTAVKNGVSQNGTWSVSSSSNKFNIDLGAKTDSNKPLGELTDDWKILSASSTEIRLADDNASSNEFLTFTKN
jgi:hypothetical protein